MASAAKIGDNGVSVKRHLAVSDGQIIASVIKKKPAGRPAPTWQSDAARIEGTDIAKQTVSSAMSSATTPILMCLA